MLTWHLRLVFLGLFLGLPYAAFAIPSAMTFQGRILKSDGSPFEQASVSFLFQILSPDGTCLLYQEQINSYGLKLVFGL